MEWDQDLSLKLISEYKNLEILWNSRNSAFYNKTKKEEAWKELSQIIGRESEELKKKIESLKGSYRREKTRVKKKKCIGKGRGKNYESKWFAYAELQFLENKDDPRKTNVRTTSEDEHNEAQDDSLHELEPESSQSEEESSSAEQQTINTTISRKQFKPLPKLSIKRKKPEESPRISETYHYLKEASTVSKKEKDQCALFGDYIADKLRIFNERQKAIAQHRISTILFELEMDMYEETDQQTIQALQPIVQYDLPSSSASTSHIQHSNQTFASSSSAGLKQELDSDTGILRIKTTGPLSLTNVEFSESQKKKKQKKSREHV